jgi:hypothetical protein
VWAFGRQHSGEVTVELMFSTFITSGVLGLLAASLLESICCTFVRGRRTDLPLIKRGAWTWARG